MGFFGRVLKKKGDGVSKADEMEAFHSTSTPVDPSIAKAHAEKDLRAELGRVQKEAAMLLAHHKTAERKLTDCRHEIATMESMAERAVSENREEDAKEYLRKKVRLEEDLEELEKAEEAAAENYQQIEDTVATLKMELEEIKQL